MSVGSLRSFDNIYKESPLFIDRNIGTSTPHNLREIFNFKWNSVKMNGSRSRFHNNWYSYLRLTFSFLSNGCLEIESAGLSSIHASPSKR